MNQRDRGVRADYVERAFRRSTSETPATVTPAQRAKERRLAGRELKQVQDARPLKPPQKAPTE